MQDDAKIILDELRSFRVEVREDIQRLHDRISKADDRIDTLEKWRAYLIGAWGVVVIAVSLAWMGIKEWVKTNFG